MKKRFLIIVLCACCVTAFAQQRRTTTTRKPTTAKKPAATAKKVTAPPVVAPTQQPAVMPADTTPKTAAAPAVPFEAPLDGYYKKSNILNARKVRYANLREADVIFAKRMWQDIDVREKMNTYMASPKSRLIDILVSSIQRDELTAYDATPTKDDPGGDKFLKPLTSAQAMLILADSVLVTKSDTAGNVIGSKRQAGEFNPDSVVRFRIKEDWVFDKQRSVLEPRIIGIAPLIKIAPIPGVETDLQPAFWIYFPAARDILATKEVVNSSNDATGLSYDDVFMKRMFTSYVTKESNNQDERIKDYAQGIDRLYESERIKKDLMDWELDLWQY